MTDISVKNSSARSAAGIKKVLIFCGSSAGNNLVYAQNARRMGALLGAKSYDILFGGGSFGLMGIVSQAAAAQGSKVTGIVPQAFHKAGCVVPPGFDEHIVETLMERKSHMLFEADAAIILPGGLGTLDELFEIMEAQDIRLYDAPDEYIQPVIVLNTNGFFNDTKRQLETCVRDGFTKPERLKIITFADTPEDAIKIINNRDVQGRIRARECLASPAP
jgi:uncharacterized protein (TIGR00730 family)